MRIVDIRCDHPERTFSRYQNTVNAIIELTLKKGKWLPQDLVPYGLNEKQINEQSRIATTLAAIELKLLKPEK